MARHVRVLIILVLAAFTSATVVQTVNAMTMNMKMKIAATDSAGMDDCEDCTGSGESMSQCDSVCVSPMLAIIPNLQTKLPLVKTISTSNIAQGATGRSGRPEPYPPRSNTLS